MLEKQNKRVEAENAELLQLVYSLKTVAKRYIDEKKYQEARSILEQVDQCMQGDSEARELLRRIDHAHPCAVNYSIIISTFFRQS